MSALTMIRGGIIGVIAVAVPSVALSTTVVFIAAEDRDDWAALCKKLAQKTAPAVAVSPTRWCDL